MLYVQRNDAGDIVATYANPQKDEEGQWTTESVTLAESDAEIVAFRQRLEPAPVDVLRELCDEVAWLMAQDNAEPSAS